MNGIGIRQQLGSNSMTSFVICGNSSVLLVDNDIFSFKAEADFIFCFVKIGLLNTTFVFTGSR